MMTTFLKYYGVLAVFSSILTLYGYNKFASFFAISAISHMLTTHNACLVPGAEFENFVQAMIWLGFSLMVGSANTSAISDSLYDDKLTEKKKIATH